ncbi:hydroxypyruvate isomerase [Kocuria tytonicola]|uniref:hydroxypyruvate isomerase family protein n=1 Tax=Kocuria tytonicola TaxID=2055946 RepID=UPI000EF8ACBA|nr:TIM barrel protein [Kocuria tytonicola]RLZ04096.1 hydroxypyruvate isomerase [Kocuria tytonicola]
MTWTVNASIMWPDLSPREQVTAVAAAGFSRAEFWWPFAGPVPERTEVDTFVAALADAGVQLTGLNFFAGDMAAGERGVLSHPGRSEEFRANVAAVAEIARATGCRAFNALHGNRLPGVPHEEQDALAVENLRWAADAVAPLGGVVLLEPLSGAPDHPLQTAADALAVIEAVDRDNMKLLADFYHLAVNGEDVAAVVEAHAADFGHIQIADAPGRHEPGTGELPLLHWVSRARDLGYAGDVALEYAPLGEDPFAWLARGGRG